MKHDFPQLKIKKEDYSRLSIPSFIYKYTGDTRDKNKLVLKISFIYYYIT